MYISYLQANIFFKKVLNIIIRLSITSDICSTTIKSLTVHNYCNINYNLIVYFIDIKAIRLTLSLDV